MESSQASRPPARRRRPLGFCTPSKLCIGITTLVLGVLLVIGSVLVGVKGPQIRHKKIRENIVVDGTDHPEYHRWLKSSESTKTPQLRSFTFYNITNAPDFLQGQAPIMAEVGPFTFEETSEKHNTTFSEDGKLVTYTTLLTYKHQGDDAELDQRVYTVNVPYSAAVNTVGGESNILKVGAQQALPKIKDQMEKYFVPALREGAVVQAIKKSIDGADPINAVAGRHAVKTLWGGGCVKAFFVIKFCGFTDFEGLVRTFHLAPRVDQKLMHIALETGLDDMSLNTDQVSALWDEKDQLSILNTERFNASIRYGIARWLGDDNDTHAQIIDHFQISSDQFTTLRGYLQNIYNSDSLEQRTIATFNDQLPAEDKDTWQISKYDDFVTRQYVVGDVIGRLKHDPDTDDPVTFESVQPDNPPEYAFYAEKAGVKTHEFDGSNRITRDQGQCLLSLADVPRQVFQTKVSGLPPPPIDRPQFVDFGHFNATDPRNDTSGNETLEASADPLAVCFPVADQQTLVHGYMSYLGTNFVADEFNKQVIQSEGGLVTYRSIRELLLGHVAPVLQLSLAKDDPRARSFRYLKYDESLNGPSQCLSAADVDNPYTACRWNGNYQNVPQDDGTVAAYRVFEKVPHTYHTGKDNTDRVAQFHSFHGHTSISDVWQGGNFSVEGAVEGRPDSVQYGYGDGTQFPPFDAISKDGARVWIMVPNFVLPLQFVYQKDVDLRGVNLKRFVLSEDTFNSSRPDAAVFSMDKVKQEGLFNLTGLLSALTYLSKPHYAPKMQGAGVNTSIQGLRGYAPEQDDSYIDIEPITGKTMRARVQLQMNVGTDNGAYDHFYTGVYPHPAVPVFAVINHAELSEADAKFFKKQVYGSARTIHTATAAFASIGAIGLLLGIVLIALAITGFSVSHMCDGMKKKRQSRRSETPMLNDDFYYPTDEEVKAAELTEV